MKEGFDYDEWYRERALELAELLMRALHVAATIGEVDELWEVIERKVKSLDLPDQPCYHCGKKISYWNWALTQGYCEECVRKLAERWKEMKFTKKKLSLLERLRYLKEAVGWLSQVYIPTYNPDEDKWFIEPFPLSERFQCFLASFETAILGYVFVMEEVKEGERTK